MRAFKKLNKADDIIFSELKPGDTFKVSSFSKSGLGCEYVYIVPSEVQVGDCAWVTTDLALCLTGDRAGEFKEFYEDFLVQPVECELYYKDVVKGN